MDKERLRSGERTEKTERARASARECSSSIYESSEGHAAREEERKRRKRTSLPEQDRAATRQEEFHAPRSGTVYPRDYLQLIRPCCLFSPLASLRLHFTRFLDGERVLTLRVFPPRPPLRRDDSRHCSREKPIAGNTSLRGQQEGRAEDYGNDFARAPLCPRCPSTEDPIGGGGALSRLISFFPMKIDDVSGFLLLTAPLCSDPRGLSGGKSLIGRGCTCPLTWI